MGDRASGRQGEWSSDPRLAVDVRRAGGVRLAGDTGPWFAGDAGADISHLARGVRLTGDEGLLLAGDVGADISREHPTRPRRNTKEGFGTRRRSENIRWCDPLMTDRVKTLVKHTGEHVRLDENISHTTCSFGSGAGRL